MVHWMKSENPKPDPETTSSREKVPVKLEIEDPLEEEHGPPNKRSRQSSTLQQLSLSAWNDTDTIPVPPCQYNPLDEPSPLGLRLRKSPSLLELIQMRLSQGSENDTPPPAVKESMAAASSSSSTDKLKASNFPALILRIGRWEYKSRYEGDLVAKCYFAKHKLVWEVLEGGLKSKIEIQWSDIMALKANCPDDGPGTLNVVLARQPLFYRETNPQPRKHTLWQATADFTDGQASLHRHHFLQCPQGLLNKHFEKLIQCDVRLNFLSQQPEVNWDSPYFESRSSICEDAKEFKGDQVERKRPFFPVFPNLASPAAYSSSLEIERGEPSGIGSENMSREAPSSSSVMDNRAIEGSGIGEVNSKAPRNWDQINVPGLHPSMSMSDLMNHVGNCISEQMTAENEPLSWEGPDYHKFLEMAQCLLSDTQAAAADDGVDDETFLMTRVNSLYCLLQMDQPDTTQNPQIIVEKSDGGPDDIHGKVMQVSNNLESTGDDKTRDKINPPQEDHAKDISGSKPVSGMSRKDSFAELLLHLPRIASIPNALYDISDEDVQLKPDN